MKVVIPVHHFPPRYKSGAEQCAFSTAARLQELGHQMSVICVEAIDRGDGRGLTYEDDLYEGIPVRRLSFHLAAAPDPFRWSYDNPWIGEHFREYLAQFQPDLVHLISGYLMSGSVLRVAKEVGIPTVLTLTEFWWLCPRINLLRSNGELCQPPFDAVTCARCLGEEQRRYRIPGRLAPSLMRAFWKSRSGRVNQVRARMSFLQETLNDVDAIVSPSRFLRDLYVGSGVAPERIVFSRQGRDFPELTPEILVKTPSDHLRVGYMGQIAPHKGVHTLFEAVRQLPDAAIEVKAYGDVGRFPAYTRRLRRIADEDPRLKLLGVYDRSEISRVLQEVDVVAVPSVCYENSPNTILEAFAHRTPAIVSDLGGMAELVTDGVDGLRFVPGDAASLAGKLRRLDGDRALLGKLREGINPVKTIAVEISELLEIYDRALGSRKLPNASQVE